MEESSNRGEGELVREVDREDKKYLQILTKGKTFLRQLDKLAIPSLHHC